MNRFHVAPLIQQLALPRQAVSQNLARTALHPTPLTISGNLNAPPDSQTPESQTSEKLKAQLLRNQLSRTDGSIYVNAATQTGKTQTRKEKTPFEEFEELVDDLKAKFPERKQDFDKVSKAIVKQSKNSAIQVGVNFVHLKLLEFIPSLKMYYPLLGKAVELSLPGFVNGVASAIINAELTEADSVKKVYEQLCKESKSYVEGLSSGLRKDIAKNDERFDRKARIPNISASVLNTILEDRVRMMSIPQAVHDLSSEQVRKDVMERVNEKPEYTRMTLKTMLLKIRDNSQLESEDVIPARLYLYGPPAVGKSTLATELVEEGLKMTPIYIDLEEVPPQNFKQYLAQKIIESGIKNPVVIIDEAGEYLNHAKSDRVPLYTPLLKKLMDPNTKSIRVFGVDLDISQVAFFIMGNSELTDEALRSKLPQLTISHLPKEDKVKAANVAKAYNIERLKKLKVPEETIEQIVKEVDKHFDFIIARDIRLTPGGRIVKHVIDTVFAFIRVKLEENEQIVQKELRYFIDETFMNSIPPRPRQTPAQQQQVKQPQQQTNNHHPGIQVIGEVRTQESTPYIRPATTTTSRGVQTEELLPSFEKLHNLMTMTSEENNEPANTLEGDLIEL